MNKTFLENDRSAFTEETKQPKCQSNDERSTVNGAIRLCPAPSLFISSNIDNIFTDCVFNKQYYLKETKT